VIGSRNGLSKPGRGQSGLALLEGVQAMNLCWWPGAPPRCSRPPCTCPPGVAAAAEAEAGAAPNEATLQVFNRDIIAFRAALPGVFCARSRTPRTDTRGCAVDGARCAQGGGAVEPAGHAGADRRRDQEPLDAAAHKAAAALKLAISEAGAHSGRLRLGGIELLQRD